MRVLVVTSLFPRPQAPGHGVFIRNRVLAVRDRGVDIRVISPVPYVPPGPVGERYARMRATPRDAVVDGVPVAYPRYAMIPKVGARWQARGYAAGIRAAVRRALREFEPDLLDAHYLYPDAVGASLAAREAGLPYVCSARGSDVHRLGADPALARQIRSALGRAAAVIAVSRDLASAMSRLGLLDGREARDVEVIPNGVDRARFHPGGKDDARRALGLPVEGRRLVCVGHLTPLRGHDLLLRALAHPDAPGDLRLHVLGEGPLRAELEERSRSLGLADRVSFAGAVPHDRIADWYRASDASIQISGSAGSPNAVFESIACGVPVLASDIPAMREALGSAGLCVARDVDAVARGLRDIVDAGPVRVEVRTWGDVAGEVLSVFERVVRESVRA